ncbi:MAG: hypothetical protein NC078_03370, partial [Ruminococcus sp.]|nr:hypothetical protein [Ruminococcus sp.]
MKKKPEWKDTKLPFCIEYNYSLFVRNRCVFFYCLARNIRKMLNFAEKFTSPSNICVIYVYGAVKAETVRKLLSEKAGNILLLAAAKVSAEDISTIEEYQKWLDVLRSRGYLKIIREGKPKSKYSKVKVGKVYGDEPSELWFEKCEQNLKAYKLGLTDNEEFKNGLELMDRRKRALENIRAAQCSELEVFAAFGTPEKISGGIAVHDSELLNIIRSVYPYGVEADTSDETAVKLLKIKKLTAAAFKGEITEDIKRLDLDFSNRSDQLCFWGNAATGASEGLEFLKRQCSASITEKGCFNIAELWYKFSSPPYGAYACNWYCYIFALALSEYQTPEYFFACSGYSEPVKEHLQNIDLKFPGGYVFVQNEQQEEFRRLMARLFDIESPAASVQGVVIQAAMRRVTNNIKWVPLDCLDHRFYEIFVEYGVSDWYKYGYEKYLPWLKENFDDLYIGIRQLDSEFHKALTEKYGKKKADFYCKWHTVKGGAVGWLHSKASLTERVNRYMNATICMECGRPIAYANTAQDTLVHQYADFSD